MTDEDIGKETLEKYRKILEHLASRYYDEDITHSVLYRVAELHRPAWFHRSDLDEREVRCVICGMDNDYGPGVPGYACSTMFAIAGVLINDEG